MEGAGGTGSGVGAAGVAVLGGAAVVLRTSARVAFLLFAHDATATPTHKMANRCFKGYLHDRQRFASIKLSWKHVKRNLYAQST
jgi:hypothetical protein